MSVVNDVTRFVDGCVQLVEYFYNCHFDRDALEDVYKRQVSDSSLPF